MTSFSYNKCTLIPHDEQMRKLFFKYRSEDVIEQFAYFILVNALFMSLRLFDLVSKQDFPSAIIAFDAVFQFS